MLISWAELVMKDDTTNLEEVEGGGHVGTHSAPGIRERIDLLVVVVLLRVVA